MLVSVLVLFFITIITIMIFLFYKSFSLRKRTVCRFVNRFSEEILIKFVIIIIIIIVVVVVVVVHQCSLSLRGVMKQLKVLSS